MSSQRAVNPGLILSTVTVIALLLAPVSIEAQDCPQRCDQKFENGQNQHRLGQGSHDAVTGPEYHETWYVNPCSTDHYCNPEDDAIELASAAIASGALHSLVELLLSHPQVHLNLSRGLLQVRTCRGTIAALLVLPQRIALALSHEKGRIAPAEH